MKRLSPLALLLLVALSSCLPAYAGVQRTELLPSAAQTASAASSGQQLSTIQQAIVGVDITAGSGTITDFDLWLECSDDGGTTWYRLVADHVVIDSTGADSQDQVNIVDNKTTTAAERYLAVYQVLPSDYVRVRWTLTGTTPSLTFSVSLVGK